MKKEIFNDTKKSYAIVALIGLIVGFATELINLLPGEDFLSASSIAGTYGFWIFSTTLIIYYSCSNKNALLNTFIYLSCMSIGFYFLQAIIDYFVHDVRVVGFIQWSHLLFWVFISGICATIAFVLFYWNRNNKISNILYALPIAGMILDTIGIALKFYYANTYFLQLILNIVFLIIMLIVFTRSAKNKLIFFVAILIVVTIGYFTVTPTVSQPITTQTTLQCELDGVKETYFIKIRDDGKILEKTGNTEVFDAIQIDDYTTIPEIVRAMQEYYESRNGTCVTVTDND